MDGPAEPVIGILEEEWGEITSLGSSLEEREWDFPSECPGWTVRDVLSHLVGTERSLLGESPPPSPREMPPHVHNPVGALNEAWVAPRRSFAGSKVLAEFAEVTSRRLEQMRSWPGARFEEVGPSPVGEVPYREFMRVRAMDCWLHEQDIRVATGRPGHRRGAVAELAIDRLASAMGFVVAKRAGAPEGSSVRFEVTGDAPRRIDVAVRDHRGVVVRHLEGEPRAVLTLDQEAFWRLACGRVSGEAAVAAGLVGIEGEQELAGRVVDSMIFMI